jgi:1,4-alpha-glucan branching enzyme
MYFNMHVEAQHMLVDRGMALHKMARLATLGASAHGYLNFMGNEFGHPEWIDFPREGNNWSYHYARRQWSLRDDPGLKFHFLADFDRAMVNLIREKNVIGHEPVTFRLIHDGDKMIVFERDGLVFVFNFNPTQSFVDYAIDVSSGTYRLALNTDDPRFGGFDLVEAEHAYDSFEYDDGENLRHQILLYIPSRTGFVLERT